TGALIWVSHERHQEAHSQEAL
ncbi:MAG: lipocalin, partial [Delftia sp.]|nr:lipocalin [Delftia sp.]